VPKKEKILFVFRTFLAPGGAISAETDWFLDFSNEAQAEEDPPKRLDHKGS
jgi:hypothetical protein